MGPGQPGIAGLHMLLTFRCADGNWINIGYYKTLLGMGYTEVELVIIRN